MIRRLLSKLFSMGRSEDPAKVMTRIVELYEQVKQEMGAGGEGIELIQFPSLGHEWKCLAIRFPSRAVEHAFMKRVRERRMGQACFTCGYNLTGNTSGVCPECGATMPTAARGV